jgi:benzylsuccinate CoA-transferase BbsF subunit
MERWGLGYESLKEINSRIIMLRTSNQGGTGPLATHPGFGHQLVALSGFCYYTGWPEGELAALSTAYTDSVTPRFAICASIAALIDRAKTGRCREHQQRPRGQHRALANTRSISVGNFWACRKGSLTNG